MVVRDVLQSSTVDASAGRNTTLPHGGSTRDYDTVGYRVYIAFLVFGIVMAVLYLPLVFSSSVLCWYHRRRENKMARQRGVEVEVATAKMREMLRPDAVYLRSERAG